MITIQVPDNTPAGEYNISPLVPPVIPEVPPIIPLRYPTGKGYYIWVVNQCQGGNVAAIVEKALEAKLNFVTIKIQNGTGSYNDNSPLARLILALSTAGVKVWGWGYCFAIDPAGEALKAAQRTNDLGLEGYMIDIESEYKNKPNQSKLFCDTIKRHTDKPLGLASYRYPLLHGDISWKTFTDICDFHNPQLYWMGTSLPQSPSQQLRKCVQQLRAVRDLPIIPIGVSSPNDNDTWRPTVLQLRDFYKAAFEMEKCPGLCYWSWQHAEKVPEWWDVIAAPLWG